MVKKLFLGGLTFGLAAMASAGNVELKLSQPLSATLKEAVCLHETADGASPEILCLKAGATVTLVARMQTSEVYAGKTGYWYKAEVGGGASGWVFSTYLDIGAADKPKEAAGGASAAGDAVK